MRMAENSNKVNHPSGFQWNCRAISGRFQGDFGASKLISTFSDVNTFPRRRVFPLHRIGSLAEYH